MKILRVWLETPAIISLKERKSSGATIDSVIISCHHVTVSHGRLFVLFFMRVWKVSWLLSYRFCKTVNRPNSMDCENVSDMVKMLEIVEGTNFRY